MKIVVLDDYQDAFRTLSSFARLAGHEVRVFHDTVKEPRALAARLGDTEAALLIQQRSALPRAVIEQLPSLKLVSQTGRNVNHIDLPAYRSSCLHQARHRGLGGWSGFAQCHGRT